MTVTLIKPTATVTEYGVLSWSKKTHSHVVDPCRDIHEALSTLAMTRRKYDVGAQLMVRTVPVAPPPGEWRAISAKDAAAKLKAAI